MKNQCSNLNTLSRTLPLRPRIYKGAMWRPPRPSIHLRIKTLDQHKLTWRLLFEVEPAMSRIWQHRESLPNTIRINQLHWQEVLFGHGGSVRDAERVFANGLDGAPEIDDLVATFEEARGLIWEVVLDPLRAGFVGLINMDALDGAPGGFGVSSALVTGLAPDGVVKDEHPRSAGARF